MDAPPPNACARLRECIFDVLGAEVIMSITGKEHQRSSAISRGEATRFVIPLPGLPELLARARS